MAAFGHLIFRERFSKEPMNYMTCIHKTRLSRDFARGQVMAASGRAIA